MMASSQVMSGADDRRPCVPNFTFAEFTTREVARRAMASPACGDQG